MRYFYYVEPVGEPPHGRDFELVVKSEDEILREWGPHWLDSMHRLGRHAQVTRENLIQDWVAVNWATELK